MLPQVVGSIRWTLEVGQELPKGAEVRAGPARLPLTQQCCWTALRCAALRPPTHLPALASAHLLPAYPPSQQPALAITCAFSSALLLLPSTAY